MGNPKSSPKTENSAAKAPDFQALSEALMKVYTRAQPLMDDIIKKGGIQTDFDPFNVKTIYLEFLENMITHPEKTWELQTQYWTDAMKIWQDTTKKLSGTHTQDTIETESGDRRFKAEEWQENALFNLLKQSYLLTASHMDKTVRSAENLTDEQKHKLAFATKLFTDSLSPTNFALTNPDVIRETIDTGGENLIRGLENLIEDLERGQGELKISTTDYNAFKVGENIATTPGHVVHQTDLMQLIQYEPTTEKTFKRPLLIIPPWINKYYILDLKSKNSFIKWAVDQGHTVFIISWANPDKKLAQKRFEDYMTEGILASLDHIKKSTKQPDVNAIGYCLGGTLLSTTLSYLQETGTQDRIASATFLTTLLDFEHAGDLKLFMDDDQLALMDRAMAESGLLKSRELQKTFSLLRANDLIWSFVVNNYLMGKEPFPFDLLYWNDDSTNMPAAMHSFYLRKMYRDNKLTKPGGITMNGKPVDLSKIKTPAYFLSTREDHIAPWQATYEGTKLLGGQTTFTLAASGHIAGVINPPSKNKYSYQTNPKTPTDPTTWEKSAKTHNGSWWPHWQKWITNYTAEKTTPPKITNPIEPAPGSYVLVKGD